MKTEHQEKQLLIVVDMINGFIREGALADRGIERIIGETVRLVQDALARGTKVVALRDCHTNHSPELADFPPHCLAGTAEVELIEELTPFEAKMTVLDKNSTSGYVLPAFQDLIAKMDMLERVVIVGCCTDICVLNLAIPLKNHYNQIGRRVEVVVPKNAVETYDMQGHAREQLNELSFILMNQAGVKTPERVDI